MNGKTDNNFYSELFNPFSIEDFLEPVQMSCQPAFGNFNQYMVPALPQYKISDFENKCELIRKLTECHLKREYYNYVKDFHRPILNEIAIKIGIFDAKST